MKAINYFLNIIRLFLIILIIYFLVTMNLRSLGEMSMTLILTFVPAIIKKYTRFNMTPLSIVLYTVIVVSSACMGQLMHLYSTSKIFDLIQHFLAGILFFDIAMTLTNKKRLNMKQRIIFGIFFSIAISALWEIGEFSADYFFNTNNQHWKFDIHSVKNKHIGSTIQPNGLVDTMTDIISAIISILLCSLYAYKKRWFYITKD